VLRAQVDSPTYAASYYDPRGTQDFHYPIPAAPLLKLAAVHDQPGGRLTLFALNRSLTEEMPLRVDAGGFAGLAVDQALQLHDADLKAGNTRDQPERIERAVLDGVRVDGARVTASLRPASWNVIRLKVSG
jgi:alpha-N-arabinofuranosidase